MKEGKFQLFRNQNEILVAILITILTIFIATKKSPFEYSLSMIGSWFGVEDRARFIIWGILVSLLLIWLILKIYMKAKLKDKRAYRVLFLAGIFLILTVLIPLSSREPIPMDLRTMKFGFHEVFATLFVISLVSSLYLFAKHLSEKNKKISKEIIKFLVVTLGGSAIILAIFGLTGISELYFFVSLSVALIIIERIVEHVRGR